jgi:hypothetical protein
MDITKGDCIPERSLSLQERLCQRLFGSPPPFRSPAARFFLASRAGISVLIARLLFSHSLLIIRLRHLYQSQGTWLAVSPAERVNPRNFFCLLGCLR